ncbi:MAG TPA: cyclase family protein [Geobacteraceae bacterium]
MQIFDITVPLSGELPVFPGDPPVTVQPVTSLIRGDAANVARLSLSTHAGTHVDVPRHCDDRGLSVDRLPLDLLMGDALVADCRGVREIGRDILVALPLAGVERLLLRTDNSGLWDRPGFWEDYCAVSEEGARYLLEAGVRLVGIDYLSIEAFAGDGRVHRLLLSGGMTILEGVNLAAVPPGRYELICLPLKVADGDGAPARAILRRRRGEGGHQEFDPHTSKWPVA